MRGRERRGEEGKEEKGRGGKGREGQWNGEEEGQGRRGGKNDLTHPLSQIPGYATVVATYVFRRDVSTGKRLKVKGVYSSSYESISEL